MVQVPGIDVGQLRRRLADEPAPFLLDVREPWEYREGHVPGAQLIPLGELEQRVNEVPRDRPILAICHSGQRSLAAAGYLQQLGYPSVTNVDGGTAAWIERGFPVEK
ncbi:MAG: rhodanese-like domain-containing protein [Chloroflexi bacterium]|nr:MAG: rhodanese-like domain-containing protein [Chloroflexota bacterium]